MLTGEAASPLTEEHRRIHEQALHCLAEAQALMALLDRLDQMDEEQKLLPLPAMPGQPLIALVPHP